MQTENLKSFFVWYVITCHLTTYRASRNRFSAISFHDYLHYCGIFLARFLIKIDLNIISNLHIVFSLCARVGWSDVCTDFTNSIKVDVDVDVMCKIRETINSFARGPYYTVLYYIIVDHIILTYLRESFIPDNKINSCLTKHKQTHKITFSRHRKHAQNRP